MIGCGNIALPYSNTSLSIVWNGSSRALASLVDGYYEVKISVFKAHHVS